MTDLEIQKKAEEFCADYEKKGGTLLVEFDEGNFYNAKHLALQAFQAGALASREELEKLRGALQKIIDMNVQYAYHRYGDKSKAENMSCVVVARKALESGGSK